MDNAASVQLYTDEVGWAPLVIDADASRAVWHAARDFLTDAREATGSSPQILTSRPRASQAVIIAGVWNQSSLLGDLVLRGCIEACFPEGSWDAFEIHPLRNPCPGLDAALVIVGGNDRGVMYGLFSLSERILGTDPMKLWTDYRPPLLHKVVWNRGMIAEGPPSVRFRGIFINDEDALMGWKGVPDDPVIEPEIHAMIVETACRLRANLLAPPMWGGYLDPASEQLIEERGLYFTACHYEVMLANPLNYWAPWCEKVLSQQIPYSFTLHPEAVKSFWRESAIRNRDRRCIWQVGLRGLTDCPFWETDPGAPADMGDRAAVLTAAIAAQISILHEVQPLGSDIVTSLTMRSEVLDMYRTGRLQVPDHVILVWDDLARTSVFRELPQAEHRKRSGGNGAYYHLTFCQNPRMAYVPPQLVQSELSRALHAGTDCYVLLNVGNVREVSVLAQIASELLWDARGAREDPNWAMHRIERLFSSLVSAEVASEVAQLFEDLAKTEYGFRVSQITDCLGPLISTHDLYPVWESTSVIDACVGRDPAVALREYAAGIDLLRQPPRNWLFSRSNLTSHLKIWDELWEAAQNLRQKVPECRRVYFDGTINVQVATGWAFCHWGDELLQGLDQLRTGGFREASRHFEDGAKYLDRLEVVRNEAAVGRWKDWFRGEYHNAFRQSLWTLKPRWHAEDSRRLAEIARTAASAHGECA